MISLNENLGGGPEQDPAPKPTESGAPSKTIDSANHFAVGARSGEVLIWKIPGAVNPVKLSRDEAVNLAAWLLVISDGAQLDAPFGQMKERFSRLVEMIENS